MLQRPCGVTFGADVRFGKRLTGCVVLALATLALAACFPRLHRAGQPRNIIEDVLRECGGAPLTNQCVKEGFLKSELTVAELVSLTPGCDVGQVCRYTYTSEDRVGVTGLTASSVFHDWRVSFDLTRRPTRMSHVPIDVASRDRIVR
jgi:hypothetical protein